jgi:hypothetical protein
MKVRIPANCIFTLTGSVDCDQTSASGTKPEPDDWFARDMHVHRNCGEGTAVPGKVVATQKGTSEPGDPVIIVNKQITEDTMK